MNTFPLPPVLPAPVRHWVAQLPARRFAKGTFLFRKGHPSVGFVIVLAGVVRVQRTDLEGRQITLYRVRAGQSCMFSTLGLLCGRPYPAEAVAEADVTLAIVPPETFEAWLEEPPFRRFAFSSFADRMEELLALVETLAFCGVAERLAKHLLMLADAKGKLERTHQALANELGATRESVSKALKAFERQGWVHLARGCIELCDREALTRLAARCGSFSEKEA